MTPGDRPLRILILSFAFPPYNTIGAVRVGKLAKYLHRRGHDLRVVAAADQPLSQSLPVELPGACVERTPWVNVNGFDRLVTGGGDRGAESRFSSAPARGPAMRALLSLGRRAYRTALAAWRSLAAVPDDYIGWHPYARRAADRLLREWRPDVIYASAMPFTTLLVARSAAARHGVPWVAELRDLWVDHQAYGFPRWRRRVDGLIEHRTLREAAALVTVSETLARTLGAKYDAPVEVITNGYDDEDYPAVEPPVADRRALRLVYTGQVYEGYQDPRPLLAALRGLGEEAGRVRVVFVGRHLDVVRQAADEEGVGHLVEVRDPVPYAESVRLQRTADALLLLLWTGPRNEGVYTGKLFEYIGARRPILAVGPDDGSEAARLIRDREAGVIAQDPDAIARCLAGWLRDLGRSGRVPAPPATARAGLTREEQAVQLEGLLRRVAMRDAGAPGSR